MKSWKTTVSAILGLIVLIQPELAKLIDNNPETIANFQIIIGAVFTAGVGLFARDSDVPSSSMAPKSLRKQ